MKTKRKSIIDLAEQISRHALVNPVLGNLFYKGQRYESGTTIAMEYLFSFPQGDAIDSTSHNTKEEDVHAINPTENGVSLLIYRLKNPALEVNCTKENDSSAILQVTFSREKSLLEETIKTPMQKQNFYVLPDSSKELYRYLVAHNSSPGSLACLAKTRIDENRKEVYVSDDFAKGRVESKYGEAIERRLNSKVKYIVDPKLKKRSLAIDLTKL